MSLKLFDSRKPQKANYVFPPTYSWKVCRLPAVNREFCDWTKKPNLNSVKSQSFRRKKKLIVSVSNKLILILDKFKYWFH